MFGGTNAGGCESAKGFIQATYPEGSICTCSNGTRTLKAGDTSAYMMFILPAIGKWTLTVTDPADPTNTDSKTVEITKEGETVSVELSYPYWLYKDGNEYIERTGGWEITAGEKRATTLYGYNASGAGAIKTKNMVDLSEKSVLKAQMTVSGSSYNFIVSNDSSYLANIANFASGEVALDISAIAQGYVGSQYDRSAVEISRVWAE